MNFYFKIAIFVILALTACTTPYQARITESEISNSIKKLSSDEFQGRKPGLPGDSLAASFIRKKFQKMGLKLPYGDGFQKVKLVTGFNFGNENQLSSGGHTFTIGADYEPLFFTANKSFSGKLTIAGYGISFSSDSLKWDDYSNEDLASQWVMIFDGLPGHLQQNNDIKKLGDLRSKVLNAIDHHAGGILVVTTDFVTKGITKTAMFDKNSTAYAVPILKISPATADRILEDVYTVNTIENKIKTEQRPILFKSNVMVSGKASVVPKITNTQNIIGWIPGNDPNLYDQYVIVGAHYDHLGFGGQGSGSRMPDSIAVHHGADDNASGVAAIIELAQKFAHNNQNKRPLVFIAFTAEEFGLIGSKAFVNDPPFSLKNANAMFNFDMIGRLDSMKDLTIGGVGTAVESSTLVDSLIHGFNVKISKEGYGPSDHASFYGANIPVIYFTSGVHDQYHTPKDTWDLINVKGEKQIVENAYTLIEEVCNRSKKLTYQESGPKVGNSTRTDLKVTLGIIPDFSGTESGGMRIDGVTPGKPASKAGLQKGDIIISIDGKKVGSIYDYMARMKAYSPGQIISVDIKRGENIKVFLVTL